jgi:DNA-binding beta-propeller fold protein YncE
MEEAKLKRDLALGSAESPTVARDHWLEVLASLKEAETLEPEEPEIAQMRAQAETELDRIDGVTRLGQVYRIYEYNLPASAPSRVIVAGLDVYVLDRGAGRVYRHALNDVQNALRNPNTDQVLLQQGQSVEDKTIGELVDINWMRDGGEGQAGALIVLDRDGLLVEHDPTWEQLGHQVVSGQDQWRAPLSLRTFDSNLYVLDPTANQIFKYLAEQFAAAPERWIKASDADLSKAVDMGIDGNIYVLHNNGRIAKYYGGEPVPFTVTKVPRSLSSAVALYTDVEEETEYIYVADASENRIVQLDREGAFVRQLQPALGQEDLFRQLSGLFVDETGAKLYFVANSALSVTDIPPVQR